MMALQRSHGALRPAVLPPDELPSVGPALAVRAGRDSLGRFVAGNREQRGKLVGPGPRGHVSLPVDPGFAPFRKWGRRYAAHRRTELATAHGGQLSAGVSALLETAGEQLAASRYLHAKASEKGDAALFKQSSALGNDARQNELAAWELAAREAKARPPLTPEEWQAQLRARLGMGDDDEDDEDPPKLEPPPAEAPNDEPEKK